MERLLLTDLLGTRLQMLECRLDGDNCCSFEAEVGSVGASAREVAAGG